MLINSFFEFNLSWTISKLLIFGFADKTVEIHVTEGCEPVDKLLMIRKPLSGVTEVPTVLLYMLSLLLMTLVFALVYLQRKELQKKLGPVFETVNKRVYYTSISTRENRDADV